MDVFIYKMASSKEFDFNVRSTLGVLIIMIRSGGEVFIAPAGCRVGLIPNI